MPETRFLDESSESVQSIDTAEETVFLFNSNGTRLLEIGRVRAGLAGLVGRISVCGSSLVAV